MRHTIPQPYSVHLFETATSFSFWVRGVKHFRDKFCTMNIFLQIKHLFLAAKLTRTTRFQTNKVNLDLECTSIWHCTSNSYYLYFTII